MTRQSRPARHRRSGANARSCHIFVSCCNGLSNGSAAGPGVPGAQLIPVLGWWACCPVVCAPQELPIGAARLLAAGDPGCAAHRAAEVVIEIGLVRRAPSQVSPSYCLRSRGHRSPPCRNCSCSRRLHIRCSCYAGSRWMCLGLAPGRGLACSWRHGEDLSGAAG